MSDDIQLPITQIEDTSASSFSLKLVLYFLFV